jgi:hypothetical protein
VALTRAIERATAPNRQRQLRAEMRLDEIVKVAGIADDYETIDRRGDLEMEKRFATLYHLVDSEAEKEAVAAAFAAWMRTERAEERHVSGAVEGSVTTLKRNNPVWIDGAAVPSGSDGAA